MNSHALLFVIAGLIISSATSQAIMVSNQTIYEYCFYTLENSQCDSSGATWVGPHTTKAMTNRVISPQPGGTVIGAVRFWDMDCAKTCAPPNFPVQKAVLGMWGFGATAYLPLCGGNTNFQITWTGSTCNPAQLNLVTVKL